MIGKKPKRKKTQVYTFNFDLLKDIKPSKRRSSRKKR
jgi:hypothetical protein